MNRYQVDLAFRSLLRAHALSPFQTTAHFYSTEDTATQLPEAAASTSEKKFQCTLCAKTFLGKLALDNHMQVRHNQRPTGPKFPPPSRGNKPQSFQSLIDGYEATHIERIDRKKYSKQPLIINGKPETEEERKARLKKVIEERENFRHKSVSVTDIPLVLDLVAAWDTFALKKEDECKQDLEEGEVVPPPHIKYDHLSMEQIKDYIKSRKQELGYDEDAHSWMSDGIPLGVFKTAADKKAHKQSEELRKVHFGSRQLGGMTENPYTQSQQSEAADLPFKCPKCGKGYRSKMSMEFHYNSICVGKTDIGAKSSDSTPSVASEAPAAVNNPVESSSPYFEGNPPKPNYSSPEERARFKAAENYVPKNPFEGNSSEAVDIHSIPEEWQIEENYEKAQASAESVKPVETLNTTESTANESTRPEENKVKIMASQAPNPFNSGTPVSSAPNPFSIGKPSSSTPNPFSAAKPSSSAPNPFSAAKPSSSAPNPFRVDNVSTSQNAVNNPFAFPSQDSLSKSPTSVLGGVTEKTLENPPITNNPFRQVALEEKARVQAGRSPNVGLYDDAAYQQALNKLPKENPIASSDDSAKRKEPHSETCNDVLKSTMTSQSPLLQHFSGKKPFTQNPFKMYSSARGNEAPADSTPLNVSSIGKSGTSNPFAQFSKKVESVATKAATERNKPINPFGNMAFPAASKVTSGADTGKTTPAARSSPWQMTMPSNPLKASEQQKSPSGQTNVFGQPKTPAHNPFAATNATNPFQASNVSNPFMGTTQQQSPFPMGVRESTQSGGKAASSKPTCPQCGLTFRLQAALDAHIASSHTVASSLYTGASGTNANEENPFQPGNVVPVIPADPFIA